MNRMNRVRFASVHPQRFVTSLEPLNAIRAIAVCGAFFVMLSGCGQAANTPAPASPPIAARPDVIVTYDGKNHACVVALFSEAQGSAIPCSDVVAFVREELKVPKGSIFDIRKGPDADAAEMARVEASLDGAGFRFIGGR